MVRIAIFALLIALVILLVRSYFLPTGQKEEDTDSMELVQDPNCEIYLPRSEAVEHDIGDTTYYFCSEKCAEEYRKKTADL